MPLPQTYPPTGSLTAPEPAVPPPLRHVGGSTDGSGVLGPPLGSGEGFSTDAPLNTGSPDGSGSLGTMRNDSAGVDFNN